jgi:hypothetical protein
MTISFLNQVPEKNFEELNILIQKMIDDKKR